MILDGKAKGKFLRWVKKRIKSKLHEFSKIEIQCDCLDSSFLNTLIIEWFDSVGIYIDTEFFRKNLKEEPKFISSTTDEWNGLQPLRIQFNSRQEATKQAIIKANEIYNLQN